MTKIMVFREHEEDKEKRDKKPIEFVYCLTERGCNYPDYRPDEYDKIMLLGKNGGFDLILAWRNESCGYKAIYLGHWNDGII